MSLFFIIQNFRLSHALFKYLKFELNYANITKVAQIVKNRFIANLSFYDKHVAFLHRIHDSIKESLEPVAHRFWFPA